jgi:hypothetical protein
MKAKRKPATKANRLQNEIDSDAEFYRKLGEAFCDQEDDISDLLTMSELAAKASVNGEDEDERIFTAHHLRDMIDKFKHQWHAKHDAANAAAESKKEAAS